MTDMQAIDLRCSRRTYLSDEIKCKDELIKLIDEYNEASGLNAVFVDDASILFKGFKASYGLLKNVRSVLLLKGNTDNIKEKAGYYGEKFVLEATKLGLGTCWIGGTFDRDNSFFQQYKDETIVCLIAVGNISQNKGLKEKFIASVAKRKTKTAEQVCTYDTTPPKWFFDGVEAALKAPTAINSQKFKFEYKEGKVQASIPDDYVMDLIDLGICKLHFEIGAQGSFDLGNNAAFTKA